MRKIRRALLLCGMTFLTACVPWFPFPEPPEPLENSTVARWNRIAVDTSGLDHDKVEPGEDREFGHQLGPTRSSRAMAAVHIAIFEAVNAIDGGCQSYMDMPEAPENTSMQAAVAQAAYDTLVELYPSHAPRLLVELNADLDPVTDAEALANGVAVGHQCASAIMGLRSQDGSNVSEEWVFEDDAGIWRVDPLNPHQKPLGQSWYHVEPFVLSRSDQFRPPPPPPLDSEEYAAAYEEVKQLGGDGIITPTSRTEEQSLIGIYWAYDGTPSLCAPPRLYNQILMTIASNQGIDEVELARLLALVNVAMADAGIAIWEAKYHYAFWRPVTGIREADAGTGPLGIGDENPLTAGDAVWTPLGAPASNLSDPNFTPPFPAYPSGHAGFGGALFQILRRYFGTDNIPFTFVSDELNGVTVDNEGNARPLIPRSFTSFSEAEEENGQSRIYLGIHWTFDKSEGILQGNRVADYVYDHAFQSLR